VRKATTFILPQQPGQVFMTVKIRDVLGAKKGLHALKGSGGRLSAQIVDFLESTGEN